MGGEGRAQLEAGLLHADLLQPPAGALPHHGALVLAPRPRDQQVGVRASGGWGGWQLCLSTLPTPPGEVVVEAVSQRSFGDNSRSVDFKHGRPTCPVGGNLTTLWGGGAC